MQAIKDLIPFNKRSLGTERLSKIISFALILGLFQLISVVEAPLSIAASTGSVTTSLKASPIPGGGPDYDDCQTGSVLYEIVASNGAIDGSSAITNTFGRCAGLNDAGSQITTNVDTTKAFGGAGTGAASASCGGNGSTRAIAGVRVFKTTNNYSAGIRIICKELPNASGTWYWSDDNMLGVAPTTKEQDLICPNGTFAVGLNVHAGGIIDAFGLNCAPVINATQSSITSVTLSITSKTYPYSTGLIVDGIVGGSGNGDFLITSIANGTATGCSYSAFTISSNTSGTCTVTVTKMADTNYAATSRTETFTFNKAPLTVMAPSPSVELGDTTPSLSPIYSGFVNSENTSSSTFITGLTAPTCTTTYTSASTIDTSPATICAGGSSVGYSFNYVPGRVIILTGNDKSISLNGTDQYLNAPDSSNLDLSGAITLEAWTYSTNISGNRAVIAKHEEYLLMTEGGKWKYYLYGASSGWTGVSTGIPAVANEWHHVALTRAASTNTVNFYLDGNLVFQGSADGYGTGNINDNSNDFVVGSHNKNSSFFEGKIDEVRVWNVVRSKNEIQSDLKTWGPQNTSGLVAYYDFNEKIGNLVFNRSTTGTPLDLTVQNSATTSSVVSTSVIQAYTIVTFPRTIITSSGGWKSPINVNSIRYLVVGGGGGGGGGFNGGGGGAGGYRETNTAILPNTVYKIEVGVGGNGATGQFSNTSGAASLIQRVSLAIDSITASGGGKGATEQQATSGPNAGTTPDGKNEIGGSGGGGTHGATYATTWGTNVTGAPGNSGGYSPVEGNAGGNGASGIGYYVGGGGGGAGGAGTNATASTTGLPGNGGAGVTTYITGSAVNLAGGGAGAGRFAPDVTYVKHGTASHGGGSGACAAVPCATSTDTGTAGTTNTGAGGGGGTSLYGNALGGNGGSGFVAIRYITDTPTILTQPLSDTTTAGVVETFTITTSAAPAPLTKSVQWQFTTDTVTGTTGWTNVSTGTGFNSDIFTTVTLTKAMNKYRYRAIVTFSDTATISAVETSTTVILTINDSITITSDTSTITRKYGSTQTLPRTIIYSGGTTESGTVGTSTSHTVRGAYGTLASGKIILDTSTSTVVFRIDTRTAVGTYVETITVTDAKGATATYAQRVVVTPADSLTISSETPTATTYTGAQAIFSETVTVTGLVGGDLVSSVTYTYSASAPTCANGGLCNVGDIGPGGGYVFYVSPTVINVASGISTGGIYLEAAPAAAQNSAQFGCTGTNISGTSYSVGSGAANTLAIINGCATAGIAARAISDLTYAGFSDWFMPSLDEMTAIYNNLYNKTPSLGGFSGLEYGSSSQGNSGSSYSAYWWFGANAASGQRNKNVNLAYRPIRAFYPINTSGINYGPTTTKPTSAGTYTITPSSAVLVDDVSTSNYVSVIYKTSTFTINKAIQETLTITSKLGVFSGNPSKLKLTTSVVSESSTVTYAIVQGGSINDCQIVLDEMIVTTAGTCKVVATMAATLNRLQIVSDTATITFSQFVSSQPVQVQLYPTMIPLNGANSLETSTVAVSTLTISSVTKTGTGAYTVGGTGFSEIEVIRIGGMNLSGSYYTVGGVNSITLSGVSALTGPLFIRKTDGQEVVYFQFDWS